MNYELPIQLIVIPYYCKYFRAQFGGHPTTPKHFTGAKDSLALTNLVKTLVGKACDQQPS